jgi:hypothetical protein
MRHLVAVRKIFLNEELIEAKLKIALSQKESKSIGI